MSSTVEDGRAVTSESSGLLGINQGATIYLAFVLLGLYAAPLVLWIAAIPFTEGMSVQHPTMKWFVAFVTNHQDTLSEFHKVLLPIITGVSVIAFVGRKSKALLALITFVLLLFVLTIGASVYFDVVSSNLDAVVEGLDPGDARAFFSRIRESLLIYLMTLLGIRVVSANANGGGV